MTPDESPFKDFKEIWKMAAEITKTDTERTLDGEMQKYGIKRIPVDYFHINGFRYTDLKDAIAQARRMSASKKTSV